MTISCPNCHHVMFDISQSLEEVVNPEQKTDDLAYNPEQANRSVEQQTDEAVKSKRKFVPRSAQDMRGAALTKEDRKAIVEMHGNGIAAARIRQELGLNITIAMINSVVRTASRRR